MDITTRGLWILGAASVVVVAMRSPANADSPLALAASSSAQSAALEEIVVTAQKREQNVQNVPLSVTALTSATLMEAGAITMQDVTALVPSLQINEDNGPINQSYRVRGVGSEANVASFEPDVALLIDGVYLPRSGLGVDDLVDLERVEVLEGPQSTLYGKNATAGVINIVTKAPSHSFEMSVEDSLSDLNSSKQALAERFAGSFSGPVSDRLRARLSVVTYNQGYSYENLEPGVPNANNMNRYAVHGEVEADLCSNTTLRISAIRTEVYRTRYGDPDLLYYAYAPPNGTAALDFGPLGVMFHITPCPDNNPNDRIICTSSPYQNSTFTNLLSATLTSRIGSNTLTSITAISNYRSQVVDADVTQVILPVATINDIQKGSSFSQEVRLSSPTGDRFEWLAGGYFQHTDFAQGDDGRSPSFILGPAAPFIPLTPSIPLGQPGDEGFLNSKIRSTDFAEFGQATFHLNKQIALTAGLRDQEVSKRASIENSDRISPITPMGVDLLTVAVTPTSADGVFSHSTNMLTWSGTAEYHPDSGAVVYLTVSRGAKSFGYNIGSGDAPASSRPFNNEYVTDYELGTKATMMNGRARLSLAGFHTEYHDFQNAGFVGLQFLVNNAPQVTVNGGEASGDLAVTRDLAINASVIYLNAKYDVYTGGACYYGEAPNSGAGSCVLSGMKLPLVPQWRSTLAARYKHPGPFGDFYSRLDWTWQTGELTDANLDPRSLQRAYSLVNLRAGVATARGLGVSLWAKNAFNQTYSMEDGATVLLGTSDPSFQRFLGRPREFGITVRQEF